MLEPAELYELTDAEVPAAAPVLIVALEGFVDAGNAARLAVGAMREGQEGRTLARFDVDQLIDYRSRRPPLRFDTDHWESYAAPDLDVVAVTDTAETELPAAVGPRAGRAVGAVRRRRRPARRAVRGAAGDQPVGDTDGGAAHAADRRDRARHPSRAHRGPRGVVHRGRRARQRCRADGAAAGRGGPRRDGLRGARAALPRAGGVPPGGAGARRPRRHRGRASTSPPRRCRWPRSGPRRRSATRCRRPRR